MLGNFTYCNPTRLYFGKDSPDCLKGELDKYGKNELEKGKKDSLFKRFMKELSDLIIIILIVAAVISGITAFSE